MKKNAQLFGGITAFLVLVFALLQAIIVIKALSTTSSYSQQISNYFNGILVFELISSILLMASCTVTLGMIFKSSESKAIYFSTTATFTIYTLFLIIDTFLAYALLRTFDESVNMPALGIAKLVFLFLAFFLFTIGLFLYKSLFNEDKACSVFAAGIGCLIVCCVLAFFAMSNTTGGLEIAGTVIMLSGCLSALLEYINSYGINGHHSYSVNQNTTITNVSNNSGDAATQLHNLKKLYDEGVITAEEYEEKRKKYIDKL